MRIHDDEDDARDDAPELPERAVLDAWTVPEVAAEVVDRVVDRVMDHVEASLPPEQDEDQVVSMDERRRGGFGWALVGVAMVAAAALVLGLVQLWQAPPPQPAAVAAPIVLTVPVPMPVPTPPASPVIAVDPPPVTPIVEAPPEEVEPPARDERAPNLEDPFSGKSPKAASEEHKVYRELKDPFEPKAEPKAAKAAKTAKLRIGTEYGHGPAKVYVDGKYVGMTPLMNVKVAPGRHTVKWVWPDEDAAKATFEVEDGETLVLKGPLRELEDPYAGR